MVATFKVRPTRFTVSLRERSWKTSCGQLIRKPQKGWKFSDPQFRILGKSLCSRCAILHSAGNGLEWNGMACVREWLFPMCVANFPDLMWAKQLGSITPPAVVNHWLTPCSSSFQHTRCSFRLHGGQSSCPLDNPPDLEENEKDLRRQSPNLQTQYILRISGGTRVTVA